MNWLKTVWAASGTAILAALAVFAVVSAKNHKATAEKWQGKAVDEKEKNVSDSVNKAKAALSQAKLHNAKAGEAKEKARKKLDAIGKKDPELASVVSGWNSSRLRDS